MFLLPPWHVLLGRARTHWWRSYLTWIAVDTPSFLQSIWIALRCLRGWHILSVCQQEYGFTENRIFLDQFVQERWDGCKMIYIKSRKSCNQFLQERKSNQSWRTMDKNSHSIFAHTKSRTWALCSWRVSFSPKSRAQIWQPGELTS